MGLKRQQRKEKVGDFFRNARIISGLEPDDIVRDCVGLDSVGTLQRLETAGSASPDTLMHLADYYGFDVELTKNILDYLREDHRLTPNIPSATVYALKRLKDFRNKLRKTGIGRAPNTDLTNLVDKYFPEQTRINAYLHSKCVDISSLNDAIDLLEDYLKSSTQKIGEYGDSYLKSIATEEPFEFILANHSYSVYTVIKTYTESNRANIKITIVDACGWGGEGMYNPEDTRKWLTQTEYFGFRKNRDLIPLAHLRNYLRDDHKSKKLFMIGAEYLKPSGAFATSLGLKPVHSVVILNPIPTILVAQSYKVISSTLFEDLQETGMKGEIGHYPLDFLTLRSGDIIITDHNFHRLERNSSITCCLDYWSKEINHISSP
jgi:hypothetical protein